MNEETLLVQIYERQVGCMTYSAYAADLGAHQRESFGDSAIIRTIEHHGLNISHGDSATVLYFNGDRVAEFIGLLMKSEDSEKTFAELKAISVDVYETTHAPCKAHSN